MKLTNVFLTFTFILSIISCDNSSNSLNTFDNQPLQNINESLLHLELDLYTVDVTSLDINCENEIVDLKLNVVYPSGNEYSRSLKINYPDSGGSLDYNTEFNLFDKDGKSLFRYRFEWNEESPIKIRLLEKSSTDQISIERVSENKGNTTAITENYIMSGDSHTVKYDSVSADSLRRAWEQYKNGENLSDPLVAEYAKFDEFYDYENTVNNNVHGELLTRLIYNDELGKWLDEQIANECNGFGKISEVKDVRSVLCFLAVQCILFKCPIGVNPICIGCALGGVIVC